MANKPQWLLYGLCFAAGVAVATISGRLSMSPAHKDAVSRSDNSGTVAALEREANDRPKPWGHLEALRIPLGNSEELFADRSVRLQPARWFFEKHSESQVSELFNSCGLNPEQRTQLLNQANWQIVSIGCFVSPSSALIRSLDSSSRQRIYAVLARSSSNYAQCFPFRFPPGDFASRFPDSELAANKVELLRGLTYTNRGTLCLTDLQVLPELLTPDGFSDVIDSLYRFPAYRLRLRVYPDSDVEPLVKYWGKGGREKKIRPLLESYAKVPRTNGTTMAISSLLPPVARLRLNTLPSAWTEPQASREDCVWTALNFFSDQPDMRLLEAAYAKRVLQTDYYLIRDRPSYGDLVTLINEQGDAVHMCVYIAEDYVFTKNGANPLDPWLIMKTGDMLRFFPSDKGHRLVIFRRKAENATMG